MTNFKFCKQNYVYSVVFVYFINTQSIVIQTLTKDTENGWDSGKGQKTESGFGNERVKELHLLVKEITWLLRNELILIWKSRVKKKKSLIEDQSLI